MLHGGSWIPDVDIRECVGAAFVPHQQRITLGEVAAAVGVFGHAHEPAVGILTLPGRNTLADYRAARVASEVYHLGACVSLLVVGGDGHGVKFPDALIPLRMHEGYFQVIADPVSTCVQEILERWPLQSPRLVTKL